MQTELFSVCFGTLGCRLNQLETEEIAAAFRAEGFKTESFRALDTGGAKDGEPHATFLCIINTCAVTAKAEQKARRIIRLALKSAAFAAVIVTGCYAQTDGEKIKRLGSANGKEKDEPPEKLVVFPGRLKDSLKSLAFHLRLFIEACGNSAPPSPAALAGIIRDFCLAEEKAGTEKRASPSAPLRIETAAAALPAGEDLFRFHSRASVKIQDGCSNACTFCKTRLARGPSVSVPSDKIIERARQIEKAGLGEVVLTGVNLHQYRDPITGCGLEGLLALLLESTERIFIRISSLYPESITPAFAQAIADKRICPFFHLSLQSGSEKIIALMGRDYSPRQIREAVSLLRGAKHKPFISCDIIAGFPGETEEDFKMTEELCAEMDFAHIHVFPFSPREGTPAASMKGRVPERVSRERAARLEALSREGKRRYYAFWAGKTLPGIFEYSQETQKTQVFTVNALSLPLDCSGFEGAGGTSAESFMRNPQDFRGAPVSVKISCGGNSENLSNFSATLENFLPTSAALC